MAGHILKIQLSDAKPPVWRRVVVPEHITFETLSDIIIILFDWTGDHLHDFEFPRSRDRVVMDNEEEDSYFLDVSKEYKESETDLDDFLVTCKSIRYVYDFGDYWVHKITWEKDDPEYTPEEGIKLLKYKGDPYYEDSGGVFHYGEGAGAQHPCDPEYIQFQLSALKILYAPEDCRHGGIRPQTQEEFYELVKAQAARVFGVDPADYASQMKKADVLQFPENKKDDRKE